MSKINWDISGADERKVNLIIHRVVELCDILGVDYDQLSMRMDLIACHMNGNPLDLDRLLAADDFTFSHDVLGIRQHINRETGKLENCFVPRCSA